MRRERGNIVLTAMGVAIVLFFLSVALVALNREDIELVLSQDQRLKASLAARAGANFALQTMRSDPQWEEILHNAHGTLGNGAGWTAQVKPYCDPQGTNYLYEIDAQGQSGYLESPFHMVVEEFRIAAPLPTRRIPVMFAYTTDGSLAMLQSTFQWTVLGPPPQYGAWLAAHNGPLFTFGPKGSGAAPPVITDIAAAGVKPASVTMSNVSPGERLVQLVMQNNQATWVSIPDPQSQLGHATAATSSDANYQGPVIDWYALTGPALAADGDTVYCHAWHYLYAGAAAQQGRFTRGQGYKLPALLSYNMDGHVWSIICDTLAVSSGRQPPQVSPPPYPDTRSLGVTDGLCWAFKTNDATTILAANRRGWSPAGGAPGFTYGLYPYEGRLTTFESRGRGLTLAGEEPDTELGVTEDALVGEQWDPNDSVFRPTTFRSTRSVHVHLSTSGAPNDGGAVFDDDSQHVSPAESGHPVVPFQGYTSLANGGNEYLPFVGNKSIAQGGQEIAPFVGYKLIEGGGRPCGSTCQANSPPEEASPCKVSSSYGGNTVAVLGDDLYAFVTVTLENYVPDPAQNRRQVVLTLSHFDGQHWQLWPSGVHALALSTTQSEARYVTIQSGYQLQPENIAMAVYEGTAPVLRRYEPLVTRR